VPSPELGRLTRLEENIGPASVDLTADDLRDIDIARSAYQLVFVGGIVSDLLMSCDHLRRSLRERLSWPVFRGRNERKRGPEIHQQRPEIPHGVDVSACRDLTSI
jgi:hypothetical protein